MVLFFGQQQIFIQLRCVTHLYCKPPERLFTNFILIFYTWKGYTYPYDIMNIRQILF